jgi:membrane protein required for colicin V production
VNWLDILLGAILVLSLIGGLKTGLARAGIGFVAVIVGLFVAMWFYPNAAALVRTVIHSAAAANVIGFLVLFATVVALGGLISFVIEKLLKVVRLSWLNRLLGGAFGLIRGVVVSGAIVLLFMAFSGKEPPRSVKQSRIAPYVVHATRAMAYAAPREIREGFDQSYTKLKQAWANLLKSGPESPSGTL